MTGSQAMLDSIIFGESSVARRGEAGERKAREKKNGPKWPEP